VRRGFTNPLPLRYPHSVFHLLSLEHGGGAKVWFSWFCTSWFRHKSNPAHYTGFKEHSYKTVKDMKSNYTTGSDVHENSKDVTLGIIRNFNEMTNKRNDSTKILQTISHDQHDTILLAVVIVSINNRTLAGGGRRSPGPAA